MSSLGIYSSQGIYNPYFAQESSRRSTTSQVENTAKSDTVQISAQAKELAQNAQADTGGTIAEQNLPLEAFSLPGWYGELSSDFVKVDAQLGMKYSESSSGRYAALSSEEKSDLAEYQSTLHKYFQDGLRQQGIESPADYYKNIVQNQDANDELQQMVRQSLAADPRAMELMTQFGIAL